MAKKRPTPERDYTPREAGEFLSVTAETVKARCRAGSIKGRKVGPKQEWRILGAEIRRKMKEWNME